MGVAEREAFLRDGERSLWDGGGQRGPLEGQGEVVVGVANKEDTLRVRDRPSYGCRAERTH